MRHPGKFFLLSAALLTGGLARAAVPLPPSSPLDSVLQRGDTAAVHHVEEKYGAGPITRGMDRAQLRYDIPQLLTFAQKCQKLAFHGGTQNDLNAALRCSYIARSATLILGNARAFFRQTQWEKTTLYPKFEAEMHRKTNFENGLDAANLEHLIRTTPPLSEFWRAGVMELPFLPSRWALARSRWLVIGVEVNGHAAHGTVEIDGGMPLRTPVVLVEPTQSKVPRSERLGLTLLIKNYESVSERFMSVKHVLHASLFLARKITVGPLTMRNVAVGVIRADFIPPGLYMGDSLWRRFGEVVVSRDDLWLSRRIADFCAPPVPLTFASNYYELGALLFPVDLLGTAQRAAVVTGRQSLVSVSAPVWRRLTRGNAGKDGKSASRASTPITLRIGSQRLHAPSVRIPKRWSSPYSIAFGAPILKKYAVHLRLSGGSPSICFTRNVSSTARAGP